MPGGWFKGITKLSDSVFGDLPPLFNPGSDLYRDMGPASPFPVSSLKNTDAALSEGNWNPYGKNRAGFDILAGGTMADKGGYRDVGRTVGTLFLGGLAGGAAGLGGAGGGAAEAGAGTGVYGGLDAGAIGAADYGAAPAAGGAAIDTSGFGSSFDAGGMSGSATKSAPAWSKWARLAQGGMSGMGGGGGRQPAQLQWNDYATGDASLQELIRLLREAQR